MRFRPRPLLCKGCQLFVAQRQAPPAFELRPYITAAGTLKLEDFITLKSSDAAFQAETTFKQDHLDVQKVRRLLLCTQFSTLAGLRVFNFALLKPLSRTIRPSLSSGCLPCVFSSPEALVTQSMQQSKNPQISFFSSDQVPEPLRLMCPGERVHSRSIPRLTPSGHHCTSSSPQRLKILSLTNASICTEQSI